MFVCQYHCIFFLMIRRPPRSTLFPTRRSSDLLRLAICLRRSLRRASDRCAGTRYPLGREPDLVVVVEPDGGVGAVARNVTDRKSTRLNSSHANISYAVFCLKKKKIYNLLIIN